MIEWAIKKGGWKNANHIIWFVSSVFLAVFTVLIFLAHIGKSVLLLPMIFHSLAIIGSVYVFYIEKKESDVFSKDCIWYNTLMIAFYAILMWKI